MKRLCRLMAAGVLAAAISACGGHPDAADNLTGKSVLPSPAGDNPRINASSWDNTMNNTWVSAHANSEMQMSPQIADRLALMPEVERAYVLLTDINAYAAIVPGRQGTGVRGLDSGLKSRVAEQVLSQHPGLREVFVSSDPKFVNRLKSYAMQASLGHPLRGYVLGFNAAMEKLFPTPHTSR